jgi:hypothetical protein
MSIGSNGYGRSDRDGLIRSYDEEENAGFGLTDLAEDSDEEVRDTARLNGKVNGNGHVKRSFSEPTDLERPSRAAQ